MSFAYRISAWNRHRKWEIFKQTFPPQAETTVLDVGFGEQEYSSTDNYLEKHYPYLKQVTALTLETPDLFLFNRSDPNAQVPESEIIAKKQTAAARYPQLNIVAYDGKTFPFADRSFDVCWSNAVVEHVGDEAQQIFFLKEIKRVAKAAFLTTPNKYFPIEVHTRTPLLHYLPKPIFDRYLCLVGKEWASGDYMRLLSLNDVRRLLKAADIHDYKIIKNQLYGFTLDFIIIF